MGDARLDAFQSHFSAGGEINVTGYSLGGHLAQINRHPFDSDFLVGLDATAPGSRSEISAVLDLC